MVDNTQTSMDSCETSTTVDSMCQMNGNSTAQSLDSYQTTLPSLDSDPNLNVTTNITNTAITKSSSTETMTANTTALVIESQITTNGSVSVEQQTQTDLIDDCLQDSSQTLVSTGSATQSLINTPNNTINAINNPLISSLNNTQLINKINCNSNTIISNNSVSTSTTTTPSVANNTTNETPKTSPINTNQTTNTTNNPTVNQPKRLHVSNIPFRFRDPDLRQLFGVKIFYSLFNCNIY